MKEKPKFKLFDVVFIQRYNLTGYITDIVWSNHLDTYQYFVMTNIKKGRVFWEKELKKYEKNCKKTLGFRRNFCK